MTASRGAAVASLAASAVFGLYWLFLSPYSQAFGPYVWRARTDDPVVAITFDDGPNEPFTSEIAEILRSRTIRATFFQVGRCVERFPAVTAELAAAGHVIGNHSFSHRFTTYLRPGAFKAEIELTQQILRHKLGKEPALARTPWLWRHPAVLSTLQACGLIPISGTFCHPLEVFQIDATKIAHRVVAKIRPGAIIIFHDGFDARTGNRAETARAVRLTIDALRDRGFGFVTVDQLLRVPAYRSSGPLD